MNKSGSQRVKEWRARTKAEGIRILGGKCSSCGYSKCSDALDFHHKNPEDKTDGISAMLSRPKKRSSVIEEIKKCILLCANCHRELHSGMNTPPI